MIYNVTTNHLKTSFGEIKVIKKKISKFYKKLDERILQKKKQLFRVAFFLKKVFFYFLMTIVFLTGVEFPDLIISV